MRLLLQLVFLSQLTLWKWSNRMVVGWFLWQHQYLPRLPSINHHWVYRRAPLAPLLFLETFQKVSWLLSFLLLLLELVAVRFPSLDSSKKTWLKQLPKVPIISKILQELKPSVLVRIRASSSFQNDSKCVWTHLHMGWTQLMKLKDKIYQDLLLWPFWISLLILQPNLKFFLKVTFSHNKM